MTPEEFASLVEEAIESRDMRSWEVMDLRQLVRFARRRNRVDGFDLLYLKWAGVPNTGFVVKPAKKVELTEPYVKRKQDNLF